MESFYPNYLTQIHCFITKTELSCYTSIGLSHDTSIVVKPIPIDDHKITSLNFEDYKSMMLELEYEEYQPS